MTSHLNNQGLGGGPASEACVKTPRWTVRSLMILVAAPAVLMGIGSIEINSPGSNCGGNAAALNDVRNYWLIVEMGAASTPGRQFTIDSATAEQREWLSQIVKDFWIRPARFLVSRAPYRDKQSGPRNVLIVCDTPFRNVPNRMLWPAPPTHAAAFSDGSIRLISTAEFKALDRASLLPLDELLATP